MRIFFSITICVCLFISGCKKSSEVSLSGFTAASTGSNWTYITTNQGTSSTVKFTLTNKDTTVNGNTYKVVSASAGNNICYGVRNGDYYRVGILPPVIVGNFEELYIKDNITVNTTWQQTIKISFGGNNIDGFLNYKVGDIGVDKTVAGKVYKDVVEVKLTMSASYSGLGIDVGTGSFYYAKGIGLISYSINIYANAFAGIPAAIAVQSDLQSYEIK